MKARGLMGASPGGRGLMGVEEVDALGALAVLRVMWHNLPLELAVNIAIIVAAIPAGVVALTASSLIAVPVAALCLGPLWMGSITVSLDLLDGRAVSFGAVVRTSRRQARRGWSIAFVPTAVLMAAVGSLAILTNHPRERWVVVPLSIDGALLTLLGLASLYAFPLAAMTALRGRRLWLGALGCVATAPSLALSSVLVVLIIGVLTAIVGPGVLVAWPAPLAIYLTAMARIAAGRLVERRGSDSEGDNAS